MKPYDWEEEGDFREQEDLTPQPILVTDAEIEEIERLLNDG